MKFWCLLLLLSASAFANEAIFDGTDPLTDQELAESETYIHEGQADRIYREQCVNEDMSIKAECSTDTTTAFESGSNMEKLEKMMPLVSVAYGQLAGMSPIKYTEKENGGPVLTDGENDFIKQDDGSYKNKGTGQLVDPKDSSNKDLKQKSKQGQDYCGKIPQFGSMAATVYEQSMDKQTQETLDTTDTQTRQAASFQALAKAHDDRSKSSKVQMGVYGATTACYSALMLTKTIQPNVGAVVKAGAALLLTQYFNLKSKAHLEKAALLRAMAAKYPGGGDCNPHTATTCFCSEETSPISDPTNYQNKCIPKGYKDNFTSNSFPCVNAAGQADKACNCKTTGTCIDSKFRTMGMQVGLNPSMMKNPLAGMSPLSTGFGSNGMDQITENNMAYAKAAMKKIQPKDLSKLNLNSKQKKIAKGFANAGIPKSFAAMMGGNSSGGSAPSIATSGLSGGSGIGLKGKGMNNALSAARKIKYGKGGGASGRKSSRNSRNGSRLGRFGKRGKKGVTGVQIMDFATRAQREAEINKDSSKPIFDIITYRYKASAWREFRDEINKQIEEGKTEKK